MKKSQKKSLVRMDHTNCLQVAIKSIQFVSIENAGKMLATEEGVTAKEVEDFKQGKQSIVRTARTQGKKHGKSGSEMKGNYAKMEDYVNSYLVRRGEFDANHLMILDYRYGDEELYRNSFIKTKAKFDKNIEKQYKTVRMLQREEEEADQEMLQREEEEADQWQKQELKIQKVQKQE
jgi:hypothetical protein